MTTVVNLFADWKKAIQFSTPTLIVREIEAHDTRPFLKFIEDNKEELERTNPTYAYGGEIDHGRLLRHIVDWKRERIESGNATLVCYGKDDVDQKDLLATFTVDHLKDINSPLEVGFISDKNRQGGIATEALESLTVKFAFERLQAKAVRTYPEWDDRDACEVIEKAGFLFLRNELRPVYLFNMELSPRNYAVYERTPT